ncbi:hypothetical protein [Flavobacterium sp. C4GT6]|uniref:hypothetical protein n=1 Tax=Flavobacterium sp. C4GT6 TaxID=3103818 RepID=UPI002ED4DCEE
MSIPKLSDKDLKNLILNENAYFYKKSKKLTKTAIETAFRSSKDDKGAKKKYVPIIKKPFNNSEGVEIATYSLDIFEFESKPTFLKNSNSYLIEKKFGLFLIIEIENYIGIIRRNVSGIKKLINEYTEGIDYDVISRFLVTENSKFEKIEASNMNTSEIATHRKISEGKDLKAFYSRFGASKEILNSIRIEESDHKHTISIKTSRVNSFNLKTEFNEIIYWIVDTLKLIDKAYITLPKSSFLDGFAKRIDFKSIINSIEPNYLFIKFYDLLDEVERGNLSDCYMFEDGEKIDLSLEMVINEYQGLIPLTKIEEKKYTADETILNIRENGFSLYNKFFKKIKLEFDNGYKTSLNTYINSNNNFIVNFKEFEYIYTQKKIFKDSKLLENLDFFFETFIAREELENITSEKGAESDFTVDTIKFNQHSLFGHIENYEAKNSKVLICEDKGTEWGDFISADDTNISFYHAKYSSKGLSATRLGEVFDQAQKNLGFLDLNNELIERRKQKWNEYFKHSNTITKISRIRKCPKGENKIEIIKNLISHTSSSPYVKRRIFIVVNFISKSKLEEKIIRLKKNENFKNKEVIIQILWNINSILSIAQERNVDFRIICKP